MADTTPQEGIDTTPQLILDVLNGQWPGFVGLAGIREMEGHACSLRMRVPMGAAKYDVQLIEIAKASLGLYGIRTWAARDADKTLTLNAAAEDCVGVACVTGLALDEIAIEFQRLTHLPVPPKEQTDA